MDVSKQASTPRDAVTAVRRFGLGPKPGDIARIASDPRGWVVSTLADPKVALIADTKVLRPSPAVFMWNDDLRIEQVILRTFGEGLAHPPKTLPAAPVAAGMQSHAIETIKPDPSKPKANLVAKARNDILGEEAQARITRAATTDTPLIERLVAFWSNHFCISAAKGEVRALTGAYERECIRPHVLGRFADMLKAVEQHPAMLIYLDNVNSVGPNAFIAINQPRGLNENLAREILELHTLGVDGGYTQADVTTLAKVITGWTYGHGDLVSDHDYGRFVFAPYRHEPGEFEILGKTYAQPGVAAGEMLLADLARHPSTIRHICRKFARHFISDAPPPALVTRLEATFRDTDGDLGQLTRALVEAPEAWDAPPAKFLAPYDLGISLLRGFVPKAHPGEVFDACRALGQPIWTPPSPKGWPDGDESWMGPAAVRERLRIAEKAARAIDRAADPRLVLADLGGPVVSEYTRMAVQRAVTREQAFELMIMSPEFQKR